MKLEKEVTRVLVPNFTRVSKFVFNFEPNRVTMNAKLTLTIDQSVIKRAKKYAQHSGNSLSSLVENYLKSFSKGSPLKKDELSPLIKSLKGSFKAPPGFNYKEELEAELSKKYGL